MPSNVIENNFRSDRLPHIWCPGCGHGILMRAIAVAIEELGLDKDKVCIVSGIGCSSRASGYLNFNTLHTTHGRAIPFATGVKFANPDMHVIVVTGELVILILLFPRNTLDGYPPSVCKLIPKLCVDIFTICIVNI